MLLVKRYDRKKVIRHGREAVLRQTTCREPWRHCASWGSSSWQPGRGLTRPGSSASAFVSFSLLGSTEYFSAIPQNETHAPPPPIRLQSLMAHQTYESHNILLLAVGYQSRCQSHAYSGCARSRG